MKPVVFVLVDAGGNVPPARSIAAALTRKGQPVHVLGHERQRRGFEDAGCAFTALASVDFWDSRRRSSLLPALWRAVRLASDRSIRDEVAAKVRAISPRVVAVDCLMASAAAGAASAGAPTAIVFHTFLGFWHGSYARGPVGVLARLRGTAIRKVWDDASMRLVLSDRTLDPAGRNAASNAEWFGATDKGAPGGSDEDPPLVLVSLSTTWFPGQTAAYQRIVDALGTLPVLGLVTTGGLEPDVPLRLPANVQLRGSVPHAEIMPKASLVIGHGGHSTTFMALAHDLPLVILPMHPMLDQPMVGKAIAEAGVGKVLPRTASSAVIAAAAQALLSDMLARKTVATLGQRLRRADAAEHAAERLLSVGGGRNLLAA